MNAARANVGGVRYVSRTYLVERLHELTPETRPGVLDELPGGIRGVVQRGRHRAGARDGLWIARWVFHYDTLP
jgi:hypothetical protein